MKVKIDTIEKNANNIYVEATDVLECNNKYIIERIDISNNENNLIMQQKIEFQKSTTAGVLNEDLLEIVKHRLETFQMTEFQCIENEKAIKYITDAIKWLNKRTKSRKARNVLGTNKP